MRKPLKTSTIAAMLLTASTFVVPAAHASHEPGHTPIYDESAYTASVDETMKKLDKLYLQFCGTCGVSGDKATKARREYFTLSRELMQKMNDKFDSLDPKMGAGLSDTETLVSIHALTMLVDILSATQLEAEMEHPHNN